MKTLLTIKEQDILPDSAAVDVSYSRERSAARAVLLDANGQVETALEEAELEEGMFEVKAKNIDEAIQLLKKDKPDNNEGKFIQRRDITFLRTAKEKT